MSQAAHSLSLSTGRRRRLREIAPRQKRALRLTPMAAAMLMVLGGLGASNAYAQTKPVTGAWFAAKGAAQAHAAGRGGPMPGVPDGVLNSSARQHAQSRQQLARSVENLGRTASAIAAQQAAQAAARRAAGDDPSAPNGHVQGGLWDRDANGDLHAWTGAERPKHTQADGKHNVAIKQTDSKAVLNWETFNVGRNTTVEFQQKSTDAVLNRVVGADIAPSQIQGAIKGDGTVMVVNQNGVVFSGSSQVNVRNLVVAASEITDDQFRDRGLYGPDGGEQASFTNSQGNIEVQRGARITTHEPGSVTQGGGYVLLLGSEVNNAGEITTPQGQATLAAGDDFYIKKGQGTDENTFSTTQGNQVAAVRNADGVDTVGHPLANSAGTVSNTGLIQAREGDVTLVGHEVRQHGVALATTTVNTRGTIHLLNSAGDTAGKVVLGEDAVTAVVIEDEGQTALDSQRDAMVAESAQQDLLRVQADTGRYDNYSKLSDRRDLSRIEIVSGGSIIFEGKSLTLATGGQIVADAHKRSFVSDGAQVDVSGAVGVMVAMESNNVQVNVQGFELRDSPLNRDSGKLTNSNLWVDRRHLVLLPGGVGGHEGDRWYTANGLLEVGGYLGLQGHSIGEWAAQGGTVTLSGSEVITQTGSIVNLAGGTLDVQTGYIQQSWLRGVDGRLYTVGTAPTDMVFHGLYRGYEKPHARWGHTSFYYNPLTAPQRRLEAGYTVGRDAGTLVISAPTAVLDGNIVTDVYNGARQSRQRDAIEDGYRQAQTAVAQAAGLRLARYDILGSGGSVDGIADVPLAKSISVGRFEVERSAGMNADDALDAAWLNAIELDADRLSQLGLGELVLNATEHVDISHDLSLADGGSLRLLAPEITVGGLNEAGEPANVTVAARGGEIVMTNLGIDARGRDNARVYANTEGDAFIHLMPGASLDTSGLWTNVLQDGDAADLARLAWVEGGSVILRSTGDVTLDAGALINASSGAVVYADGTTRGSAGGDITLIASSELDGENSGGGGNKGELAMDGQLRSYGFTRGGELTLQTGGILSIGGQVGGMGDTLGANIAAPYDLTLSSEVTLPVGTVLSFDRSRTKSVYEGDVLEGGDILGGEASVSVNNTAGGLVTLMRDWVVPVGISVRPKDGSGNSTIVGDGVTTKLVAGTMLRAFRASSTGGTLPKGFVVPEDTFQYADGTQGLKLQGTVSVLMPAGAPLTAPVVLESGFVLPKGSFISVDVQVKPIKSMALSTSLFSSGFSSYAINGQSALIVTPGTQIHAKMPVYRFSAETLNAPTGSDLAQVASPVFDDEVYRVVDREVVQRPGADLSLTSFVSSLPGVGLMHIQAGSEISVDPGHSVRLAGSGSVLVDGTVRASGGAISIVDDARYWNYEDSSKNTLVVPSGPGERVLRAGGEAVLDAAARAWEAIDPATGLVHGIAPNGGSITLGRDSGGDYAVAGYAEAADAYIEIAAGARLDVSGTSASVERAGGHVPPTPGERITLASAGGLIDIASYNGIDVQGELRGASGGPGASGGALHIMLETPYYPMSSTSAYDGVVPEEWLVGRVLTLGAGSESPGRMPAQAWIEAASLAAGGFGSLDLGARDAIVFDGDMALAAGRSIALRSNALYAAADSTVSVSAPHVLLTGLPGTAPPPEGRFGSPSTLPADRFGSPSDPETIQTLQGAALNVHAGLLDVGRTMILNFAHSDLSSTGDMRFLASPATPELGSGISKSGLDVWGDLTLRARQIYPDSHADAEVYAGFASLTTNGNGRIYDPEAVLSILSTGDAPALPYSVFGRLVLAAPNVVQAGLLRAPLGSVELGLTDNMQPTRNKLETRVELRPGSITSVSAAGLVMPYGGTPDGESYLANGMEVAAPNLFSGQTVLPSGRASNYRQGITISGTVVDGAPGAVLDLSGGGELLGAAFISGRGGSVDVLATPLANANPAHYASDAGNQVFAIVPGATVAPASHTYSADWTGDVPEVSQTITLREGVPGLAAGTYTLMPAYYALMPGAFRVELGGPSLVSSSALLLPDGAYATTGVRGIAGTSIHDSLDSRLLIMPGEVVRRYAHYNEQGYAAYQLEQAEKFSRLRSLLPRDGKFLTFNLVSMLEELAPGATAPDALRFDGAADFSAAQGGYGGTLILPLNSNSGNDGRVINSEFYIAGQSDPTGSNKGSIVVSADAINAFGAASLAIGAAPTAVADQLLIEYETNPQSGTNVSRLGVTLGDGAVLKAGQVVLAAGEITLGAGAGIDTRQATEPVADFAQAGFALKGLKGTSLLAVSNGGILLDSSGEPSGRIEMGEDAFLYGRGTIGFLAQNGIDFLGRPKLGANELLLSMPSIHIGTEQALTDARQQGQAQDGLLLDQSLLTSLLSGDPDADIPGVKILALSALNAINFYGTADLSTVDPVTGESRLSQLVLNTPALYGAGTAGDVVNLNTDVLVWNGNRHSTAPGDIAIGGPGTGQGVLNVHAREIVLGYPDNAWSDGTTALDKLALGFGALNLNASERIVVNDKSTLRVFEQADATHAVWDSATGLTTNAGFTYDPGAYRGAGGNLNLMTPLFSADAAAIFDLRVGGRLNVAAPDDLAPTDTAMLDPWRTLGATVMLEGDRVNLDSAVYLPSGRLTVTAMHDLILGERSRLDLAGHSLTFFDQAQHAWGGEVLLESTQGNITQASGGVIDVSSSGAAAGSLTLTATSSADAQQGGVRLAGVLLGHGGPGAAGGVFDLRGRRIGADASDLSADFAVLNSRLDEGGFTEARRFVFKEGNLEIGDTLKASEIVVSVDGGRLTVRGHVDAGGAVPGSIRLAARDGLTIASSAVLDVRDTDGALQRDSDGMVIGAKNRGKIELTAAQPGWLTVESGATFDLSSPDGVARGTVDLNAWRQSETGDDIKLNVDGPVNMQGAQSVAVHGFWHYSPEDGTVVQDNGEGAGGSPVASGGALGLDQVHARNTQFINAALGNSDLAQRLQRLGAVLRPGVEITSNEAGVLRIGVDLDLSRYRYGPYATGGGWGQPGKVVLRSAGNVTFGGGITDGFIAEDVPAVPGHPADGATVLPTGTNLGEQTDYFNTYGSGATTNYRNTQVLYVTEPWTVPAGAVSGLNGRFTASFEGVSKQYTVGETIPAGAQFNNLGLRLLAAYATDGPALTTDYVPLKPGVPAVRVAAPMLPQGALATMLRVVAGADLSSADSRSLRAASELGDGLGQMHFTGQNPARVGVLRTGAGDLDILAGGDWVQDKLYNISTNGWGDAAPADLYVNIQGSFSGLTYAQSRNGNDGSANVDNWVNGVELNTEAYNNGFTGIGAMGGGNVTIRVGGDAGLLTPLNTSPDAGGMLPEDDSFYAGTGLVAAVAGGGDLRVDIGGLLNPYGGKESSSTFRSVPNGSFINLRGDIRVDAGAIGVLPLIHNVHALNDPRAVEPGRAPMVGIENYAGPQGGVTVVVGDGLTQLNTRGDLVLNTIGAPATQSYWRPETALDLFAAGGNLAPIVDGVWSHNVPGSNLGYTNSIPAILLPPVVSAVAASGSLYYGSVQDNKTFIARLLPSVHNRLTLMAADSIYGAAFGRSITNGNYGAPGRFAIPALENGTPPLDAQPIRMYAADGDLVNVALGETYTYQLAYQGTDYKAYVSARPADVRAGRDIVNFGRGPGSVLNSGYQPSLIWNNQPTDISRIQAGRDMFYTDVEIAGPGLLEVTAGRNLYQGDLGRIVSLGLLGDAASSDPSGGAGIAIMAGAGTAGPRYDALAALYLDPANQADLRPGYPLADQPGKVAHVYSEELLQWLTARFAQDTGQRFADDGAPAVFDPATMDALAFFKRLPSDQQAVFLRQVYDAELIAGGREYNDPDSTRFGSYLRGRQMIATLFPVYDTGGDLVAHVQSGVAAQSEADIAVHDVPDANGVPYAQQYAVIERGGDFTMFSSESYGSNGVRSTQDGSVRTIGGGDIGVMAPAGQIVAGIEGVVPGTAAGILTQGQGSISLYSQGSLLLGLSRIMTTYGGGILGWSTHGDINAGRGSKTTQVYTPPRRLYDDVGNVTRSPQAPTAGAGIATKAPIPEVPGGNVDLIAPLGTIDAGEAGIESSGSVNVAALQVVNAANIQAQGEAVGLPAMAVVNVSALTSASAAASSAASAAQDTVARSRAEARQNLPSIINVQILGFGNEAAQSGASGARPADQAASYRPDNLVQVVGRGDLSASQLSGLTADERRHLDL